MDELSPDQLQQLCCFPPYFCDYADAVHKYFGDDPPDVVYEFLNDIVEFQRNLRKVKCEQEGGTGSNDQPPCAQCKRTHELIDIIDKHVQCLNNDVSEVIKKLFQLKCKIEANSYVSKETYEFAEEDKPVNDVIDFARNLHNHVKHLKEFVEIIRIPKVKE